jgi:hypothetical protein
VTVVGVLLALAIFALYAVMLLVGYINGVAWVADLVLRRWRKAAAPGRGALVLTFALVLGVLLFVQLVPLVGQLAGLVVWFIGIGSLVMVLAVRYGTVSVPPVS